MRCRRSSPAAHLFENTRSRMRAMPDAFITAAGMVGAVLTTMCWIPQALKIIRERRTADISLLTQGAFFAGICLWLIYGWGIGDLPLIIANTVTLFLTGTILALKVRYG
jgi:MtN3 and saliva related transmembrane protein